MVCLCGEKMELLRLTKLSIVWAGSTLNKSYTGLCMSADKNWYYVKNGVQDTSYTGLVTHQGLQYYVQDGCLNWYNRDLETLEVFPIT